MLTIIKNIFSRSVGRQGEDIACDFLKQKNYSIKERNYKNKLGRQLGEIDIIAENNGELVFCEVKTRKSLKHEDFFPEENINLSKLKKLQKIAGSYLKERCLWDKSYRFDAVSICLNSNGEVVKINHIKNIFI